MNILYVIGNGFDKAQGMNTSYPEFYEYLKTKSDTGSPLLRQVVRDIKSDIRLWSDMEEALGKFTEKVDSVQEFDDLHYELSRHLQDYLRNENNSFIPPTAYINSFQGHFVNPDEALYDVDRDRFNQFIGRLADSTSRYYYVMTFNYTNTIERLLSMGENGRSRDFNGRSYRRLVDICHVHGRLGETIIMGVDNEGQIANARFRSSEDVDDFFVKIKANESMKNTRHSICESYINKANLIVFYGVSFGVTDQRWWKLIGEEMEKRSNLAIVDFEYKPKELSPDRMFRIARVERACRQNLLEKMGIEDNGISERMFFVLNSDLFNNPN